MALEGIARPGAVVAVTPQRMGPIADAIAAALCRRGINAQSCDEIPDAATSVVFVGGLAPELDDDAQIDVCRQAFRALKSFAARALEHGGSFVTLQDTGGDFGISGHERAFLAGLAGLVKTADLEWPLASLKAIDVARAGANETELAERIVDELLAGGPEIEVGLSGDRRLCPRSVLAPIAPKAEPRASVLVCSGGARGVTAATLIALARRSPSKIALLGRTALEEEPAPCRGVEGEANLKRALMLAAKAEGLPVEPAKIGGRVARVLAMREVGETLAALAAAGAEVMYLPTDVADRESVATALEQVRQRFGPITALVHGAGVVADKNIVDKSDEQLERVLAPKIGGLRALLAALAEDPLHTIVLFSSVAGRTGNVGQCDYAMANEMLNKVAARERRRRPGSVVKSLGWGPWEGGMVTPALKAHFEAHGVALIPLEVGAKMLVDELAQADSEVELVLGGEPRRAAIAGEARAHSFVLRVARESHPHLTDHRIEGTVVLPVVQVLEWFTRAAEAITGRRVAAIEHIRLFRGVTLPRFDHGGDALALRAATSTDGARLALSLCDVVEPNKRYYAAEAVLCDTLPVAAPERAPAELMLSPRPGAIYGDSLFHGPELQVIRNVQGVSDGGIVGELDTTASRAWRDGPYRTDMAALDGGLQLALLFSEHCLGGRALPTALGAYQRFTAAPPLGPVSCTLIGSAQKPTTTSDITFRDAQGKVVARLCGVETHQRP